MDSIVHGTTVGTNTLLERRGPEDRRHHHARLSRRARDAPPRPPPHLGPVGRLHADRRPRHARRGRRAHARRRQRSGRRSIADEVRAAAKLLAATRARRPSPSSSSMPTPTPRTSAARSTPCATVWPNDFVTASHEVLSEIREFERSSTTALNAYLQPVVASYIGKLEAALAAQDFAGQLHIVQSNGGIMSTATARRLPVRTALSGPAAGVVAGAAHRQGRGLRQSHHLRSRRHLVRRVGDRRRQGLGRGADHDRFRPGDPHADDRDHHHRRGRRLDRLGRSRRPAAGRPGKRRLGAGAGVLRRRATRGRR